ncbi:FERM and PDZ domain-containing protein 1 [Salmo salar]|uniref:FERM and PDZ domain-containing protein 1 n=1 Tax=Salmo salar TaxID=8030 RepID=A0ABM3EB86_SALSA|nr:FERM and PDZ domain-containing protein 1 [Salmo salar]
MEERDRSRSPSRRTSRVEQVVGRWLRRSRDSSSRERILVDGKAAAGGESSSQDQKNNYPVRLTVQILRDPLLNTHGLTLTPQTPILVQDVTPAGPADGRLVPGDQVVKINNVAVDDLTPEQAADLIRECQYSVMITVLRNSAGPKSSFITPEKRAKLRSNPVKVRFAEEVEVNSHSQGNSLLFLPNVLKVYLENGQTKAFKFEPNTTVKDIVMTLKEKLSLSRIEHFSLVLEQKYSISKLLLLHEEERIQQVVHQKEVHDYRCLFRVCFIPREPEHLLQDDPTAFQYLYLQGINDVLQERFAVEMRCNTALRLAALHIQERLASCGQSPRTKLKIITKSWGIENFISSTLLRNMREKDLRKAIGYHMKKSQSQEPKQKVLSANQAKINYLEELCDLKSFGGKSFSATMMLQDRESMVTLLVGSRHGISQVVNHKLSIMTTLTEFSSITRIELLPESDRVSLVKIYLQDIKPITLLLESVAAKELSCLVAGYCRALVDPSLIIFPWTQDAKQHRVSAEEGYVSRCGSDSDDSSDMDMDTLISLVSHNNKRTTSDPVGLRRIMEERKEERKERKEREERKKKGEGEQEKNMKYGTMSPLRKNREKERIEEKVGGVGDQRKKDTGGEAKSEKQRGAENRGLQEEERKERKEREERKKKGEGEQEKNMKYGTMSPLRKNREKERIEEKVGGVGDQRKKDTGGEAKSEKQRGAENRGLQEDDREREDESAKKEREGEERKGDEEEASDSCRTDSRFMTSISSDSLDALEEDDLIACSSSLPHPHPPFRLTVEPPIPSLTHEGVHPHPKEGQESGEEKENLNYAELSLMLEYLPSPPERDARHYYNICPNVTPDSTRTRSLTHPHPETEEEEGGGEEEEQGALLTLEPVPILQPPPGFGDSSSDEEFFDARDRFASPEDPTSGTVSRVSYPGPDQNQERNRDWNPDHIPDQYPDRAQNRTESSDESQQLSLDPEPSEQSQNPCPTVSSLSHAEGEASQLESKPILTKPSPEGSHRGPGEPCVPGNPKGDPRAPDNPKANLHRSSRSRRQSMETEPDVMESKSVTALVTAASLSITAVRCRVEPDGKESTDRRGDGEEVEGEMEEEEGGGEAGPFTCFLLRPCSPGIIGQSLSASTLRGKIQNLPLYLSRSQETLTLSGVGSPNRNPSPETTSNKTEVMVTTETTKDDDVTKLVTVEDLKDSGVALAESDDSEVTLTESEVGEVVVETAGRKSREPKPEPCPEPLSGPKMSAPLVSCPSAIVVTTQSLNGPGLSFPGYNMRGRPFGNNSFCKPPGEEAGLLNTLTTGCGVFTSTCETQPNQAHMESYSPAKPDFGCSSVLASGCETVLEGVQTPLEACRCPPPLVCTNCFSGGDSFDDELTVYEFSCRTTSFPRSILPPSSSMELTPLLSPLLSPSNCFLSQSSLHDDISRLRHRRFPPPPAGFQTIRSDVDELLTLLQGGRMGGKGGRHPRETCATHFSENKRLLHMEARRLMAGCQKVVRVGQTPDEMLFSLSDSFRTLVGMAGMCLWFSGCDRCDRRNAEALAGLADVARTYREFVLAAERASGRRSCHDLSTKLLAKQCTALTASVFCLTQLFRTLTAL